jgi:quinol---cytochrome c reductase iron-sulfur subunit, bacillus type
MPDPTRRGLLEASIFVSGAGFALALGLPGAAYVLTPLLRADERTWVDLGEVDALRRAGAPLAVRFRYEAQSGYTPASKPGILYVVPDAAEEAGVRVLSPVCSHKGCNVAWSPEEELFACPCHRGRFDRTGEPVSGPPKGPLARIAVRVDGGRLWAELAESAA